MSSAKKATQRQPDLTIVIPAYQEGRRISATLDKLAMFLKHDSYFKQKDVEVLVVAADAPDRTNEIVLSKRRLFQHMQLLKPGARVGKGRDVQYGMLRASGKIVMFMDADLATPLPHLKKFYRSCLEGSDIVIGTRNLLHYTSNPLKCMLSKLANIAYQLMGGVHVEDTQCGFKLFSQHASKLCFSKLAIQGWSFDMEILAIAHVNKLSIRACRINDWRDMPYSTHTERALTIAWRSIRDHCYIVNKQLRNSYTDEI